MRCARWACASSAARTSAARCTARGGAFPVQAGGAVSRQRGTAFRPLTAVLALGGGDYRLSGVPRMHERPIGDLVDALRQLGADIDYLGKAGLSAARDPSGGDCAGRPVSVRGDVSSQFLTALLMALPLTRARRSRAIDGRSAS